MVQTLGKCFLAGLATAALWFVCDLTKTYVFGWQNDNDYILVVFAATSGAWLGSAFVPPTWIYDVINQEVKHERT